MVCLILNHESTIKNWQIRSFPKKRALIYQFSQEDAMVSAFYTDTASSIHTLPGHPEHAGRLEAVLTHLEKTGVLSKFSHVARLEISDADLERVHTKDYLQVLERVSQFDEPVLMDADTYLVPESYGIARQTVGGIFAVAEAIAIGSVQNGLVVARPPGHHATPGRGMGFCILNNVALTVRYIQSQFPDLQRIAVIDYDVHHGNGTQDAFYEDRSVLFISSHQSPLYPGTGNFKEQGKGSGLGYTLNLPVLPGVGDATLTALYEQIVLPALHIFQPNFMIVSAGFDSHWRDPLAQLQISLSGLARITQVLFETAQILCGGRILFAMEGGYDLEVLAHGIKNIAHILLGDGETQDMIGPGRQDRPLNPEVVARMKSTHPLFEGFAL
jgi:acetoin utilization deacetylase AcuC-like enzyme